jgi:hypothetical protein
MSESEMVERVASAAKAYLHERADFAAPINFDDLARATIFAMREPTEAMMNVTGRPIHAKYEYWQPMIDSALGETTT